MKMIQMIIMSLYVQMMIRIHVMIVQMDHMEQILMAGIMMVTALVMQVMMMMIMMVH